MSYSTVGRILLSRTSLGAAIGRVPGVKSAFARYAANRLDSPGVQWGVWDSHDAAAAAVPPGRNAGWDNESSATIWTGDIDTVRDSAYPALFWLKTLLCEGSRVTDLGGSIGLTYYGLRRFTAVPEGVQWTIVEVPHIAEEGRRIAKQENAPGLVFESDLSAATPCDVFLAAGALQYMPESVPGLLERLNHRPKHMLITKVPLSSSPEFWTLQNFGPAVAPYHVYNEAAFMKYFADRGYEAKHIWGAADLPVDIPFHPKHSVPSLTGMYFQRRDP